MTTSIAPPSKLPTIVMPDGAEMGMDIARSDHLFVIETSSGPLQVSSYGDSFFICRGIADALVAHGLIASGWLPGLAGNNRTQQAVAFGKRGACLIFGNRRGGRLDVPSITIKRVSRTVFEVHLPPTPEQKARLEAAWERRAFAPRPTPDYPSVDAIRFAREILSLPPGPQAIVRRLLVSMLNRPDAKGIRSDVP